MNDPTPGPDTRQIVVDEFFPHAPETIWNALTDSDLIGRWMPMQPTGFKPVIGKRFTLCTTPAGAWDGTILCEVLEVVPNERLAFAWRGGHEDNVGYGSTLDTVVTFSLSREAHGTRIRLIHSGFVLPRNATALAGMSSGWPKVVESLAAVAGEGASSAPFTGGCACGQLRYEVVGEPVAQLLCQCRQCQRQTGTGHSAYLIFSDAGVSLSGDAAFWDSVGDSGTIKRAAFCPNCGSPTYLTFPSAAQMFAVLAGSLDEPKRYAPQIVVWTEAGHSWDWINPELTTFDKLPPSPGSLA